MNIIKIRKVNCLSSIQKTLFDELYAVAKKSYDARPLVLNQNDLVPSGKGIIFPCVVARRLPVDERPNHMKDCNACKRLEKELDDSIGVVGQNVWY